MFNRIEKKGGGIILTCCRSNFQTRTFFFRTKNKRVKWKSAKLWFSLLGNKNNLMKNFMNLSKMVVSDYLLLDAHCKCVPTFTTVHYISGQFLCISFYCLVLSSKRTWKNTFQTEVVCTVHSCVWCISRKRLDVLRLYCNLMMILKVLLWHVCHIISVTAKYNTTNWP